VFGCAFLSKEGSMSNRYQGSSIPRSGRLCNSAALRIIFGIAVCLSLFLFIASQSLGATATRYIRSNGGDCASIGTWDQATKTCTLTGDFSFGSNGIVVDGSGITVDGAGHTITGSGGFTSGVSISVKSGVVVRNLTVRQFRYGFMMTTSTNATVTNNTVSGNLYGVYMQNASGSRVYNNNFDSNTTQARVSGGTGNLFSLPAPVGGNWWNGYDSPAEGCNDYNSDYFCDVAYNLTGAQDPLPWNTANAWSSPPAPDTEAPAISSVEPSGVISSGTTAITVRYTDRSNIDLASGNITLDGDPVAGCTVAETMISCPAVTGYATGDHTIGGSIADILGNTAAVSGSFSYIDDQPPVISDVLPSGFLNAGSPVISASYSDSGTGVDAASVSVTLDGTPLSGCAATAGSVSCPTSGLADGVHNGVVSVADFSANVADAPVTFIVDTAAPQVTGVEPTGVIGTGSATVQANFADGGSGIDAASVTVDLDGVRLTGCNAATYGVSCSVKNLTQGAHVISGAVSDLAGNTSAISGQFTFTDTTPPLITDLKPAILVNKPSTIVGASFTDKGVGVDKDTAVVTMDGVTLTSCTFTNTNASCAVYNYSLGAHSFSVQVADKAGNLASASGTFTYDPNAPTVSKTVYLTNNSTGGGCSQVGYWVPSTKTCVLKEDLMFIATNGIVINGDGITLDGGGHYIVGTSGFNTGISGLVRKNVAIRNLTVKKFKYAAYMAAATNSTFHNNTFTENTYGIYMNSSNGNVIYNNNFLDNRYPVYMVGGTGNQFSLPAPDGGNYWQNFDTPDEGCSDGGGDGFCDASYSVYGATDNLPWTVQSGWPEPPAYDGMAPTITGIQPTGVLNTGSATISAYYSDEGTGVDKASVAVYLDGSVLGGCSISSASASCNVYGLTSGSHTIMVSAADNVGNAGSAIGVFSVDITPPVITNVVPAGYINTSSATVGAYVYDAVSGVNAASIDMYVEGGSVSGCGLSGTSASCSVYGLAEGAHNIRVTASDLAGNSASATGYLSVDTGMPQITNMKPTGTVNKTSATISAYLADSGSGINSATAAVYLDGTALTGCTLTSSSASCNVYNMAETAHTYSVLVADRAGNIATASGSFTVDTRITTKYLRLNATGGDCTAIGNWNNTTRTCTLTSGYTFTTNGITIEGDGITLDGGGYTLTGAGGFTSGITASIKSNVSVRNIKIRQFRYGINLVSANNPVITGNSFISNTYGTYLQNNTGAMVYGNNFDANTTQAYVSGGSGNIFNQALPTGGNWWSNFDTAGEGCTDADSDGFCDAAYSFTGGTDALPHVLPF